MKFVYEANHYIYRVGQKNRTVFRSLWLPYMLT